MAEEAQKPDGSKGAARGALASASGVEIAVHAEHISVFLERLDVSSTDGLSARRYRRGPSW